MPKVSVIIPAYNQDKYLEDALNSVLNQTFTDWDCIVVDDGSTDNTEEIAKKYVKIDNRFKYIYQKNKGLAGARNTGIKHARGNFIQFLDSDDVIDVHKLEKQTKALDENLAFDIASCDFAFFPGNTSREDLRMKYVILGQLKDQLFRLFQMNGNIPSPIHIFLIRKTAVQQNGFFDETFFSNEDRLYWTKYCLNGGQFYYTPGVMAYYRLRSESMSLDSFSMAIGLIQYIQVVLPLIERSSIKNKDKYAEILINGACRLVNIASRDRKSNYEIISNFLRVIKNYKKRYAIDECNNESAWMFFVGRNKYMYFITRGLKNNADNILRIGINNFRDRRYISSMIYLLLGSLCFPPYVLRGFKYLGNHYKFGQVLNRKKNYKKFVNEMKKQSCNYKLTLEMVNNLSVGNKMVTYYHSASVNKCTLYSSIYAVSVRHLLNGLQLSDPRKNEWAEYIQSFQCDDGLWRDPAVANEIAEIEDWWGWRHLTCHALIALTALGSVAKNRFKVLEPFYEDGFIEKWLESKDWEGKADSVSNEILNYGTLLQYARDFHNDRRAKKTLTEMYDWLDLHQESKTGLWGPSPIDKRSLSIGVQTAYHIWLLYFYDKRQIRYIERGTDSCLATQNKVGGFGVELNSSACEDIDSIDPLVRSYFLTDYRRDDIKKALTKAYKWVLVNMNEDGGFVFKRGEPLIYGHKLLSSKADESAMFPTWFRTLSLAYLSKVIDAPELKKINWNFVDCPGYQFWRDKSRD